MGADERREGHLASIFPEGHLTRDGEIAEFRAGMLRILTETPVPVIPLAVSNLWGSMFSRFATSIWNRLPRRYLAKITLAAGEPIAPENADLKTLRDAVVALRLKP